MKITILRSVITLFFICALAYGATRIFPSLGQHAPKHPHVHAGFQVFEDEKLVDFSDWSYMEVSPCDDKKKFDEVSEKRQRAHLHDAVGDVVHVHRDGATFSDLFDNLKFRADELPLRAVYVDGQRLREDEFSNNQDLVIQADKSYQFFYGDTSEIFQEEQVKRRVTPERIAEVSRRSESCATE